MEVFVAAIAILTLAIIPMVLYALILWRLDRYEKEPAGLLLVAFLWGAIPAVAFSLVAQIVLGIPGSRLLEPGLATEVFSYGLIAPLTEEPFKGLMLLLLLLFFRREIDSPLDGILYGGLVGFGFAATENLLYFLGEYGAGGLGAVLGLAFYRVVLFGLNHALFTGCTGLGIAVGGTAPSRAVRVGAPLLGLGAAVVLHTIHNVGAVVAELTCFSLLISLIADWGGVLALVGTVLWASAREREWIRHYLEEETRVGTLSQRDYLVVQSSSAQSRARLNALLHGDVRRWWRLGRYYQRATELAFVKHRWAAVERERSTALHIEQLRRELYELRKQL
jgi:RsiW-degrading membrane proteinase PrsW (M82 family)